MHNPAEEVLHKVVNPYAEDNRYLYFFSNPPHLLKTIRNCWQSKSRNLWVNFLKYCFYSNTDFNSAMANMYCGHIWCHCMIEMLLQGKELD